MPIGPLLAGLFHARYTRRMSDFCDLPDGRRIPYTLQRRERDPFYLVCFRDPNRKRKELSTKAANLKRAKIVAAAKISEAYGTSERPFVEWDGTEKEDGVDGAIERLKKATAAKNIRPTTIEQYVVAIRNLRKFFPDSKGPADITPGNAQAFIERREAEGKSPRTLAGNITNLSIVFGRWFRDTCKIVDDDPFAKIERTKLDQPKPRVISDDERQAFVTWLLKRWDNWRLPVLFLEIKASIGCRIGELASLKTEHIKDGRVEFKADVTKGRKERAPKLPAALFAELKAIAGPTYAFERFADELRAIHDSRGLDRIAARVGPFSPERMYRWLQDELKTYCRKTGAKRFKWHNFRGTAMSKARDLGIPYEDGSEFFGCGVETMRKHYVAFDSQEVSDSVADRMHGERTSEK